MAKNTFVLKDGYDDTIICLVKTNMDYSDYAMLVNCIFEFIVPQDILVPTKEVLLEYFVPVLKSVDNEIEIDFNFNEVHLNGGFCPSERKTALEWFNHFLSERQAK
jgi:hypothetical protein